MTALPRRLIEVGLPIKRIVTLLGADGWQVESVEKENRGFDPLARKPHAEDPKTAVAVRFVEVKAGRASAKWP